MCKTAMVPTNCSRSTRGLFPFVEVIFADGGYQGPRAADAAAATGQWRLEIVKRNDVPRFEVLPKRWIVERTLAWISRNRRLARDFERYATTVVAFVRLAMIRLISAPPYRNPFSVDSNFPGTALSSLPAGLY